MCKGLYESCALIRDNLELSGRLLGFDMVDVMQNGPEEVLTLTQNAQPAILAHSIAISDLLSDYGSRPDMVAGLSLGEFSALVVAGSLNYSDALRLVRLRGLAMQEAISPGDGTMAAIVGLPEELVERICGEVSPEGDVIVANYNCPGQLVVSGLTALVRKVVLIAQECGARRTVELSVSAPFHSKFLQPVGEVLKEFLRSIQVRTPKIPVISNVTAEFFPDDPEKIKELLIIQAFSPVKWEQTIRKMLSIGVDRFVEVGPGRVLNSFVKKIDRNAQVSSTDVENLAQLREIEISA
jgi:[acyl-carrier-protein] S-malonyltransferase